MRGNSCASPFSATKLIFADDFFVDLVSDVMRVKCVPEPPSSNSSTIEFHASQSGHFPAHLKWIAPQFWQEYAVFFLVIIFTPLLIFLSLCYIIQFYILKSTSIKTNLTLTLSPK